MFRQHLRQIAIIGLYHFDRQIRHVLFSRFNRRRIAIQGDDLSGRSDLFRNDPSMSAAAQRSVDKNSARLRIQPGQNFCQQNRHVARRRHASEADENGDLRLQDFLIVAPPTARRNPRITGGPNFQQHPRKSRQSISHERGGSIRYEISWRTQRGLFTDLANFEQAKFLQRWLCGRQMALGKSEASIGLNLPTYFHPSGASRPRFRGHVRQKAPTQATSLHPSGLETGSRGNKLHGPRLQTISVSFRMDDLPKPPGSGPVADGRPSMACNNLARWWRNFCFVKLRFGGKMRASPGDCRKSRLKPLTSVLRSGAIIGNFDAVTSQFMNACPQPCADLTKAIRMDRRRFLIAARNVRIDVKS